MCFLYCAFSAKAYNRVLSNFVFAVCPNLVSFWMNFGSESVGEQETKPECQSNFIIKYRNYVWMTSARGKIICDGTRKSGHFLLAQKPQYIVKRFGPG